MPKNSELVGTADLNDVRWTREIAQIPEDEGGRTLVDFTLKDGTVVEGVTVEGRCVISFIEGQRIFDEREIIGVRKTRKNT